MLPLIIHVDDGSGGRVEDEPDHHAGQLDADESATDPQLGTRRDPLWLLRCRCRVIEYPRDSVCFCEYCGVANTEAEAEPAPAQNQMPIVYAQMIAKLDSQYCSTCSNRNFIKMN